MRARRPKFRGNFGWPILTSVSISGSRFPMWPASAPGTSIAPERRTSCFSSAGSVAMMESGWNNRISRAV